MDLSKLAPTDEGTPLEILHPSSNQPTGVKIWLSSKDSPAFRKLQNAIVDARLKASTGSGKRSTPTIAAIDGDTYRLLASVTKSWEGVEWNGAVLECTPENAVMLYEKIPWLKDQVDAFINERANFLGN